MKYLIVIFFSFSSLYTYAQKSITGKILNEAGEGLYGSTVVLLTAEDSTMTSFALTDDLGRFRLDDVSQGDYILQASYISYSSYSESLDVDWSANKIDVGVINLSESTEILQEITVTADHIPMGIRGDTISYNASAFKTRPNASVEELLKKLPGIEVERNGNIKAQGEDVENVLVDGKEFFGGNPTMATKNLEAEAIDKVEVYDKQSEIAVFTGIDDGNEEKTINLQLKEDHKNGGFGNVDVAGGTEDSYDTRVNYFRFSPAMQASVILSANNINEETFTFQDRIEFMGGIANAMASGGLNFSQYEGLEDGLNESASLGTNMNYDFSPKLSLRSYYLYNRINNVLDRQSYTDGITDNFGYTNLDTLYSEKTNGSHQLNTKFNYKVDPFTEFIFQNNFNFKNRMNASLAENEYLKEGSSLGYSISDFSSMGDSWGFDSKTLLKRKFNKKGRSIIGSFTYKRDDDDKMDYVNNRNRVEGNFLDLIQNQSYANVMSQVSFDINITEPIASKYFFGINYNYGRSSEKPERLYFDVSAGSEILNEDLSALYNKLYTFQRGGINLRRNAKKLKMNWALSGQLTNLEGVINSDEDQIKGSYTHLLPSYSLDYEMKGGKNLNFDYNTNVIAPQLDQLMPLPDNTNPNFQYIGNPELVPQYDHRLGLSFHWFDNFNFTSLFANVNYTSSNNRIVYRTNIDENLFQSVEPVNSDSYNDISAYLSLSKPFRPLKLKYSFRSRFRYANYDSFINDLNSNVTDNNMNFRFSLSNRKTDKVLIEAGITMDFSKRKYGINPDFNQSYQNTQYFFVSQFYIKNGWTLSSEIDYTQYSSGSFNDAPSFYYWSASLSKLLFQEKLELRITANDILNQNIGYRRSGDSNSIQQVEYATLGRFFMVGLNYRIGKGNNSEGGMRIDMN